MGHYRKIDPYIWNDEKFMGMSANGQLACIFIMTHPHMTAVGGLRSTIPGVASEHSKLSEKAFREVFAKGIAKADDVAPLIWFPNFLKYNPPENPNVVRAWSKSLEYLPECETKRQIIQNVKDFLKDFSEAFQKAWPQALPKQEQEQEQEQKDIGVHPENPKKKKFEPPTEEQVVAYFHENGYSTQAARRAFKYYDTANWKDARGNQVKNWKQKMISVWFKTENEIQQTPAAKKQKPVVVDEKTRREMYGDDE